MRFCCTRALYDSSRRRLAALVLLQQICSSAAGPDLVGFGVLQELPLLAEDAEPAVRARSTRHQKALKRHECLGAMNSAMKTRISLKYDALPGLPPC